MVYSYLRRRGETGRRAGLKILWTNHPCRFESDRRHQTRIKRTREKILSSFYFIQEIISDLKSNVKYHFNVQPSVSNTRFFYAVLPSDLSPFVCGCSTVKSESQRQKFLPKTLKLPTIT